MRVYHYTNLESLALILKNKTIRFNCLDQVDDVEEGNAESLGVRFCQYVFVSCWTESPEESIPLWKMYSDGYGGVRISIEKEMFQEYLVSDLDIGGQKSHGSITSKIPPNDMKNNDFFILPFFDYDNDLFYRKVIYVDDVYQYTKDAIQINNIKDNRGDLNMEMKPFGYYKNKRWEFQNETRYVIYALPINPLLEGANPELSTIITNALLLNKSLPFKYYDMQLNNKALENIEITLSPSATDAQRVIAQTLIEKYAPQAKIHDSSLGKVVRLK